MMGKKIIIFDTTLRDGEQTPGASLQTVEKVVLAKQLERLGVDVIEAGFPISSPGDFQSVKEVGKIVKNAIVCGLSRAIFKDIDVAAQALEKAKYPRIHTGIGASDVHIKYKLKTTREKVIEQAVGAVKHAKKYLLDVEFYAEDAGRADPEFLYRMLEEVIKAGATTLNIPDTTGYRTPVEFGALIAEIRENVAGIDKVVISAHCHDDLGLAVANSLAAIQNGARQVEGTINGVGERAGNAALEEVIVGLAIRRDFYNGVYTNINMREIYQTSRMVSQYLKMPVQKNKAIVGENAFAHSSGIHQDGVLKYRLNYEIIDPKMVGVGKSRIILTARSGRHALKHKLTELGYTFRKETLDQIYQRFLYLADRKKEIYGGDLVALVEDKQTMKTPSIYQLKDVDVRTGTKAQPKATLVVEFRGKKRQATATGNGPVAAAYQAINTLVGLNLKLKEYLIQPITEGKDADAQVSVMVETNKKRAFGKGLDSDIVVASVKAYLDAINKL